MFLFVFCLIQIGLIIIYEFVRFEMNNETRSNDLFHANNWAVGERGA